MNKIIEELLNHSKKYFIDSIIQNIEIQCQINAQQGEVKGNIRINFKSVKPYVEFIKVIDGKKVPPALRITFKIDIDGTFEGLKIHSSPTISVGQGVKRKEISLDKFSFDLTISIIKLPAFNLVAPIFLNHKELFKVENLHFYLVSPQFQTKEVTQDPSTLNNKGVDLYNLGKYEEAIEWYNKAITIDPNFLKALINKGLALQNLGKYQEAIDCYDKVLVLDPKFKLAKDNKKRALRGFFASLKGKT